MERFLRPKSYRVLEVLAERRGRLVSKDDLVHATWPDVFVSDDSLVQCVSDIRKALGPEGTALLRTVPRRGYLLVGQDLDMEEPAPVGRRLGIGWASWLTASLIVAMTILWWIPPRDASAELAAADRDVVQADTLLMPRNWRRRGDNVQARGLLESVVAENPGHAGAWASLGLTYWLEVQHLAWGGGRREMAQALEMVERAVTLGGGASSHRLLAEMRLLSPFPEMRSPVDALANARAAVTIAPDDPDNLAVLAQALALTGRSSEAIVTIQHALSLNPAPPDWHHQVAGLSYLLAGEPARAAEEFGPLYGAGTFVNARWWPGWLFAASLAHAGRLDEAARVVTAALGHRPQTVAGVAQSLDGLADNGGLTIVLEGLRLAGMPG